MQKVEGYGCDSTEKNNEGGALETTPPSWNKFNVDESVKDGHMHMGCVVRNSRGLFVATFSLPLGWGTVVDLEILSALHAIKLAQENGWTKILIESDYILVVSLKSNDKHLPWRTRACWDSLANI